MMNAIVKDVIFYVIENNTSFQIGDTNGIKQELVVVVLVDYNIINQFILQYFSLLAPTGALIVIVCYYSIRSAAAATF